MLFLALLAGLVPVLANPIAVGDAVLNERATQAVPVQTPTGTVCAGATPTSTVTPTELALAVAGCPNVQPAGTDLTRNDILDGICKPFTLIFARGTTEDPNLGNIVGPPFVFALEAVFGKKNVAVQGVNDYAAIGPEYCTGGSLSGSQDLADLIVQTSKQCPKTKLAVSGYSQGSQVVHNAFAILADTNNKAAATFVNSVILFGDPDRNVPIANVPAYKVSIDCHIGDNICANGENVLLPHVTYCHDVGLEAAFAKARSLSPK